MIIIIIRDSFIWYSVSVWDQTMKNDRIGYLNPMVQSVSFIPLMKNETSWLPVKHIFLEVHSDLFSNRSQWLFNSDYANFAKNQKSCFVF